MRKAKHVHVQMFPLEDVLPNPYRKIKEWTLDEEKIERLMHKTADIKRAATSALQAFGTMTKNDWLTEYRSAS